LSGGVPIGEQFALAAGMLAVACSGPAFALIVLLWRKRKVRLAKRTPLTGNLLRGPGYALREQLEDLRLDAIADLMMLGFIPLFAATVHLAQSYLLGARESRLRIVLLALAAVAFVGFGLFRSL
jgi:hypothetical protein